MTDSKSFQFELREMLRGHFVEVLGEWSVSRGARDALTASNVRYAPRIDIAVGPFSIEPGNQNPGTVRQFGSEAPPMMKQFARSRMRKNRNARCALAIEIVFSGSSKHVLGDITNASMMGLYGFVVANEGKCLAKARRI